MGKKQKIIDLLTRLLQQIKLVNGYMVDFDEVLYYPGNSLEYKKNVIAIRDTEEQISWSNQEHIKCLEIELEILVYKNELDCAATVALLAENDIIKALGERGDLHKEILRLDLKKLEKKVDSGSQSVCQLLMYFHIKYQTDYFGVD